MPAPSPEYLGNMIQHYIETIRRVLAGFYEQMAWPLVGGIGLFLLIAALSFSWLKQNGRDEGEIIRLWRRYGAEAFGYVLVALVFAIGWSGLQTVRVLALQDIHWRETAEVTKNPVPDATPVSQYGPAVARLSEKPYTRSLTLPPDFLNRLSSEGVEVLAPYLTDPTAGSLVRLRDTFKRNRRRIEFTRQATLLDEVPIPFTESKIDVRFKRLPDRAYEAAFEGHYLFENKHDSASTIHFLFTLPEAGAIRDLSIMVGKVALTEPTTKGTKNADTYEWKGEMQPGEKREAVVSYRVNGSRAWSYDLGSPRRRVQQFHLDADTGGGGVGFLRGSLLPTTDSGNSIGWDMSNVVTAQQIAVSFAPDSKRNQLYLQALSVMPVSLLLFLIGALVCGYWFGPPPTAERLLGGVLLFAFGLGSATVLTIYCGAPVAFICGPVIGAGLASATLGRHSLLAALPVALLPFAFLSEHNSGLIVFILTLLTLAAIFATIKMSRRKVRPPLPATV
jgi:hypothetical protein